MPVSHRRSAGFGARRPQRRKLVWATDNLASQTLATGAKLNRDLLANLEVAGSSVLGATVMRIHISCGFNEATADTGQGGALGIIVDSAPTVTNLDPAVAFGDDWMYLRIFGPSSNGRGNTTIQGTNWAWGEDVDIRSKRKIEELGEKLFLCYTNLGSGNQSVSFFTRALIALP
jgi:hypothetical protein